MASTTGYTATTPGAASGARHTDPLPRRGARNDAGDGHLDFPIYMLAYMFLVGAICWLLIDPHQPVFDEDAA